jgi:hypothetical protein
MAVGHCNLGGARRCRLIVGAFFPTLMTEFTKDGAIDLDATARHIEACLEAGI